VTLPVFVGIVNVTSDSFSDGGRYLAPQAAVERALGLRADGADFLDPGAESTHPDAADVSAALEIDRLLPVVTELVRRGVPREAISIDTWKPEVMTRLLEAGAGIVNDVFALRASGAVDVIASAPHARVVLMHSACEAPRAIPTERPVEGIVPRIAEFFEERLDTLACAGVGRERCVLDPGMGFFLGAGPEASVRVLRGLRELERFGCPIYVSVSRKSFLGALTSRPTAERGAATLGAELFALTRGASWVRTHDVRALRDAHVVWSALESAS